MCLDRQRVTGSLCIAKLHTTYPGLIGQYDGIGGVVSGADIDANCCWNSIEGARTIHHILYSVALFIGGVAPGISQFGASGFVGGFFIDQERG